MAGEVKIGCILVLLTTGCSQLNTLAIDPEDNGMACIKGSSNGTSGVISGDISGVRVELPAGADTSSWTAEDWRLLAEICD